MFMDIYGSTYTVAMQPYLPYLYALLEYDGVGKAPKWKIRRYRDTNVNTE